MDFDRRLLSGNLDAYRAIFLFLVEQAYYALFTIDAGYYSAFYVKIVPPPPPPVSK
jgi:hypothetical protein